MRDAADGTGATPRGGAHVLRIAYATTRADGAPALATARVWIPDRARADGLAVVAHATVGLADACAPSAQRLAADALVAPWAAHGWATIAPDYAGLGSPGTQGYGDGEDTARSTLDAVRALRGLLGEGTPEPYVIVGHSQGGGAALSAQAIASRYGPAGLAAVIAIAPGWPVRASVELLRDPDRRIRGGDELSAVVAALALYAWHARALGDEHAGDGFHPDARAALVRAVEHDCIGSLVSTVPRAAPRVGALVDPSLREALVACADGTTGCTGTAAALWSFMRANVLTPDPAGAPVAILTGADDALITPARVQCVADHLRAGGVDPGVCVVPGADHVTIVPRALAHAIAIAEAAVSGGAPPGCSHAQSPVECDRAL